jgi:hypothetical protein
MSVRIPLIAEVTRRATYALIQEIGVVDTIRFLNQFRTGKSNYTLDREHLFDGRSVKDIAIAIKARRADEK